MLPRESRSSSASSVIIDAEANAEASAPEDVAGGSAQNVDTAGVQAAAAQDSAVPGSLVTGHSAQTGSAQTEHGGRDGPEPTRFGDWEKAGRCIDF